MSLLNEKNSIAVVGDIRKSEKLIKAISIDAFTQLISTFLDHLLEITNDYNCILERFTGDGFVVIFPSSGNTSYDTDCSKFVERIMRLYREYLIGMEEVFINQDILPKEYRNGEMIKIHGLGIGIDYGRIRFNIYGNFFYSVGLPILRASRFCQKADPWQVVIGEKSSFVKISEFLSLSQETNNFKSYKYER